MAFVGTAIEASPPVITGAPMIMGTALQGAPLTVLPAVVGGSSSTQTWQWRRGGTLIATTESYTPVLADVGQTLTVTQIQTNPALKVTVSATSAPTATVASSATGTASIVVLERAANQTAPEALKFGVVLESGFTTPAPVAPAIIDERIHKLDVQWDFGTGYDFVAPTSVIAIGAHKNSRYSFNWVGATVYRAAGTYTVTATITEPSTGVSAVATLSVTIGNPSALFPTATQTIVVDSLGVGLPEYPGATIVASLEAAYSAVAGGSVGTARRVVLIRGRTYSIAGKEFGRSLSWPTVHFVAGGSGAKPIVNYTGTLFWRDTLGAGNGRTKDMVWQNIKFVGQWDVTTETGTAVDVFTIWTKPPMQFLLDGCEFDRFKKAVYTSASEVGTEKAGVYCFDSVFTGWQDYGLFVSVATTFAVIGCAVCQNPNALAGNTKDAGTYNHHGCIRIGRPIDTILYGCELFSHNGWWRIAGPLQDQQACFRYDTDGLGGGLCLVTGTTMEGGSEIIKCVRDDPSARVDNPSNMLVDMCYLMATHASRTIMEYGRSGETIRACIANFPLTFQLPGMAAANLCLWFDHPTNRSSPSSENRTGAIRIYSNTFINQADTAVGGVFTDVEGLFTGETLGNNIRVQVNASPTSGPALDTTPLWTPRTTQLYTLNAAVGYPGTNPVPGTATPATAAWRGEPSSPVALDGSGLVSFRDFFGVQRGASPNQGAI